ncbi:hypothetical protein [Burkholderia savannae]|uniref:hypothetical protein n=1 Tax=Burkholderia savannae TaxID=1637837 RepID=UPI0012F4DD3C|nr:hypothetical protein [Burkholderia savannae]
MASSDGDGRRNYYIIRCNQPDTKFLNGTKSSVDASHECSCARRDEDGTKPGRNGEERIAFDPACAACIRLRARSRARRVRPSMRIVSIRRDRAASCPRSVARDERIAKSRDRGRLRHRRDSSTHRPRRVSKPRIETANRNRPLKPIRRSMTPRAAERIPHVPSEFAPIRPRAPRSRARTRRMLRRKSSREDGPHRF